MAAKLFRAIVGFGIGLGAASAACFDSDAGTPEHCYALKDAGACDVGKMTFPFCVNEDWECSAGTTTGDKCK